VDDKNKHLSFESERIEVTRLGVKAMAPIEPFLTEETISPEQIGDYKLQWHQGFIRTWMNDGKHAGSWSFPELWRIREECIAALEQ
jgi:hypothetical protein